MWSNPAESHGKLTRLDRPDTTGKTVLRKPPKHAERERQRDRQRQTEAERQRERERQRQRQRETETDCLKFVTSGKRFRQECLSGNMSY